MKRSLHVGQVVRTRQGRGARVSAMVDRRPLWFASSDEEIVSSPEAFGSALLIPALSDGRCLTIEQGVCATWCDNLSHVIKAASRIWNYGQIAPRLEPLESATRPCSPAALCFSGGVDSFHSLLRGPRRWDLLVSAIGYDVKLDDVRRIELAKSSVRAVAAEMGIGAIFIASNLRCHASFRAAAWDRTHGGALAALGHLLGGRIGRLAISASVVRGLDTPIGSRWDIDPFFSSRAVAIDHIGVELWRADKLRAIAHEEIVRRHLQVCWENRSPEGNCCRCEKCLRTMLILATCGQLESHPRFHGGRELLSTIEQLSHIPLITASVYEDLLKEGLTASCAAAVRRLLARSYCYQPPLLRRARTWLRRPLGWMRKAG